MTKGAKIYLFPVIAVLGIIPFVTYNYTFSTGFGGFAWYPEMDVTIDFFLYYKSVAVIIVAAIMACLTAYQIKKQGKQIRFTRLFIPLFLYGILTLLSSLFSEYSYYCFHGSYELFESIWVLLGYVMIAYYTYLFVDSKEKVEFVLKGWFGSIAVMCLLGFTQLSGFDFFNTVIGRKLISSGDIWEEIEFSFDKGRVYLSLYNPNYVGSYAALIIPLLLVFVIYHKSWKLKSIYSILLLGVGICLLGSQSRTGILCIMVALFVFTLLCYKQLAKYWKTLLGVLIASVILLMGFNKINDNVLLNRLTSMFTPAVQTEYGISAIDTGDDMISMYYKDSVINFQYTVVDPANMTIIISMFDENGVMIDYSYDAEEGVCVLNDERFPEFVVAPAQFGIAVFVDGLRWDFTQDEKGSYYFYNAYGKPVKLSKEDPQPNYYPIFNYIGSFSGRDHIWSNSIPLLKNSLILGSGPDTFTLVYPQEFYIYNMYNSRSASVDVKPHNMYLQIGIQSGVLALIAVLFFYGMYFVQSFKLYRKNNFETYLSQTGVGIFIGTLAYMLTGIANDSCVVVAPLFWALMGIGIAVNEMVRKSNI